MDVTSLILMGAFLADWFLGDPVYRYHPIRLMGRAITWGENRIRGVLSHTFLEGAVLALLFPVIVFGISALIVTLSYRIHFGLGFLVSLYGIYTALSVKDLRDEGLRVYRACCEEDLGLARREVSRIVGRDTADMQLPDVQRAAVETIAESTVDGVIAPLFYAVLGGAPLALTYKAVNTLDSIIGNRNEKYHEFGRFAAKQDEVWNWVPSRFSYVLIALAALLSGCRGACALKVGWSHVCKIRSTSSNVSESAYAGALGLQLGGPSRYGGQIRHKPLLGIADRDVACADILRSLRLMRSTAWVSLILFLFLRYTMSL
ncbi:MAG: adenosylcobinamide-phosphate synthase CbiB [Candidatus Omnitrophota bacterium]|nr:adenosylcobinamide-phosphate synthase CbiB [Candidatus Omnitrophota bacterium]